MKKPSKKMDDFDELMKELKIKKGKQTEIEKESIILTKKEINKIDPAISHLIISLGDDLKEKEKNLLKEIYNICDEYIYPIYHSVKKDLEFKGDRVIVEGGGAFKMFEFLHHVIKKIKSKYEINYNIVVKGNWPNDER
jgi:hypothetical protein